MVRTANVFFCSERIYFGAGIKRLFFRLSFAGWRALKPLGQQPNRRHLLFFLPLRPKLPRSGWPFVFSVEQIGTLGTGKEQQKKLLEFAVQNKRKLSTVVL
jgi:hypothetical protein